MPFSNKDQELILQTFRDAGSNNEAVAVKASAEIVKALEEPIRQVLLSGDTLEGIFSPETYVDGREPKYHLDLLTPSNEKEYAAYVHPGVGYIPQKRVTADWTMVPTYEIANAIDIKRTTVRDASWNVVQRMMEILEAGFVMKMNDDGWQTLFTAGVDRGLYVNDTNAAAGQLTPRLITLLQTVMRRNGGGNTGSRTRSRLTHLFVSPEAQSDIRTWTLDLVPDEVRKNIYYSQEGSGEMLNVFGTEIRSLDELGEGQEYQNFFTQIGGTLAGSDVEVVIGLDKTRNDSFVMPVKELLTIQEDPTLRRHGLVGWYGHQEQGFACLDSRRVILGSL
jgi:hypothetical protein